MNEIRKPIPISAVANEVLQTLQEAQKALEQFHADKNDQDSMGQCIHFLHQVKGTLEMLGEEGLSKLADECESLAVALKDNSAVEHESSFELLSGAILFMPRYLEYMQEQTMSTPSLLLPTINALRKVQKTGLIPEHKMAKFSPDVHEAFVLEGEAVDYGEHYLGWIKRIRHMYQIGLVGVIRGNAIPTHLKYMNRAVERLSQVTEGKAASEIVAFTSCLLDSIEDQGLKLDASVKHILGLIDRQLKELADNGQDALDKSLDDETRNSILYYIAKSSSKADSVKAIKMYYRLYDLVPDEHYLEKERNRLQAPDRSVIKRVAEEILESLNYIKDRIDCLNSTGSLDQETIDEMEGKINQMAITLEILDLKQASQAMKDIAARIKVVCVISDEIRDIGDTDKGEIFNHLENPNRDEILDIASTLLGVEVAVSAYAGSGGHGIFKQSMTIHAEAQQIALKEVRTGLDQIKNGIASFVDSYLDSYNDPKSIEDLPAIFSDIKGAMWILQRHKAAAIVGTCLRYLNGVLLDPKREMPSDQELDTFADVLASLDWYFESLETYHDADENLLNVAVEGLQDLGFTVLE